MNSDVALFILYLTYIGIAIIAFLVGATCATYSYWKYDKVESGYGPLMMCTGVCMIMLMWTLW